MIVIIIKRTVSFNFTLQCVLGRNSGMDVVASETLASFTRSNKRVQLHLNTPRSLLSLQLVHIRFFFRRTQGQAERAKVSTNTTTL